MLCCGYTLTDFPISIRLTSLALWQSSDCPSASKATLMNMDRYFMWIHYEQLHNHNKAKHNKTVCIFLGLYCMLRFKLIHASKSDPCSLALSRRQQARYRLVKIRITLFTRPWWRHQMKTFSALLAICAENSPVPGEFSTQRPVTRSFDVYFDLRPNKGLSKQLWGWWFETQSCPLWRHRNDIDFNKFRRLSIEK